MGSGLHEDLHGVMTRVGVGGWARQRHMPPMIN